MSKLFTPISEAQACDCIASARADKRSLQIVGGGTRAGLGRPVHADAILSTQGLRGVTRSVEYGSAIIHSIVTGQPRVINGNVLNHQLIDNLPQGCAVEVPCLVDHNGVQPTRVGKLPVQLAALMRTNVNVQELVVEAVLQQEREHVYHAAMLDPHTAATLDLAQIRAMVDELLTAKQQLELALATARSSVTAQEQVVASMLERLTATPAEPDLAAAKDAEAGGRKVTKKPAATGT